MVEAPLGISSILRAQRVVPEVWELGAISAWVVKNADAYYWREKVKDQTKGPGSRITANSLP